MEINVGILILLLHTSALTVTSGYRQITADCDHQ